MRFAESCQHPAHRSFWRQRLERRAGDGTVEDYLIDQANLRGFLGAYRVGAGETRLDPSLSLEDLVVGLLAPHAEMDARVFKLVVRLLQSGQLQPRLLWLRARRERADHVLYWLLQRVPESERNPALKAVLEATSGAPRGYRPPRCDYRPERLLRRPASAEDLWRRARR